jgi:hypothetical protein
LPGQAEPVTLGDVWDAIEAAGLRVEAAGMGKAYFDLPDGRTLRIPNKSFWDHGIASESLLEILKSTWGIAPTASGKYGVPDHYPADIVLDDKMYLMPKDWRSGRG